MATPRKYHTEPQAPPENRFIACLVRADGSVVYLVQVGKRLMETADEDKATRFPTEYRANRAVERHKMAALKRARVNA